MAITKPRSPRWIFPALIAAASLASGAARAQIDSGLIPAVSASSIRVGDLRSLVGGLLTPDSATTPGFTISPSIGIQELLTDNVLQQSRARGDLVTSITPGIAIGANTNRIQGNLSYSPSIQIYAATSQQDQIAQNFNGSALLTAVPDLLFLSLRGYGSQQSTSGNAGQSNAPVLSRNNRTQTIGFSGSPYLTHRFGGDGNIRAGVSYDYTMQTGSAGFGNTTLNSIGSNGLITNPLLFNTNNQTFPGNSTTTTTREFVTYTTGENLGRFSDSINLEGSQTQGSGVLTNSHRSTAINSVGYGLNRNIALLGTFGYENISYAGFPPVHISDAVYTGGFRLTPNQNSSLTVTYGHKDGFNAANVNASYLVTARLRVFGNYSAGLTSSQQEVQDNLDNSTVDQFGNSIDGVTGAPVLISDSVLGLQNNLYRLRRASASAVLSYDVDTFTLNVLNENRNVVSVATTQAGGNNGASDRGLLGSVSWTHELRPDLSVSTSVQYGTTTTLTNPNSTQNNLAFQASTGYALSETLTATAQYYVNSLSSNIVGQGYVANVVLLGIRKSF